MYAYITSQKVAEIRAELKATFPNMKLSVTRDHATVRIVILESPMDWNLGERGYDSINPYYPQNCAHPKVAAKMVAIARRGQGEGFEDSDYGHIPDWYVSLSVGRWDKPHVQVKKSAKGKAK